ncbi:MAG TPA: paraquat-inducible protein A [Pseudomonadales bacterium]|nr:paraquat-inducible protein A [Pseudomonadales bacterium]
MPSASVSLPIACTECDLLLEDIAVPAGSESACPRCGHVLREGRPHSVLHALLLSSCGLVFFGPAIGLPLLAMSTSGLRQASSLAEAVLALGDVGFWEVATLVTLCAIIAPFLNLWLMFSVSVLLLRGYRPRWLPSLMRINHHAREWAMLDVFFMGIIVSIIKLKDTAELIPGMGLYCFVGLMLSALLMNVVTDEYEFWQLLDRPLSGVT